MSSSVLFSRRAPSSLHAASSFGHSSGLQGPAPSGSLLHQLSPLLRLLHYSLNHSRHNFASGICFPLCLGCSSPRNPRGLLPYPLVSVQRSLLRRPFSTTLFKMANHYHIPYFPSHLYFFLPSKTFQHLIYTPHTHIHYISLLSAAFPGLLTAGIQ